MQQHQLQPYLFFNGRCDEAIDFYGRVLGAEVIQLFRYKDNPEPTQMPLPPGSENKVMHACIRVGDAALLASDGMCSGSTDFRGFSLAYTAATDAAAETVFAALGDGGQVQQPLIQTFFSSRFGMLTDRFGVGWMVTVAQAAAA